MSSLSLPNPCRLFPFSMQDSRSRLSFLVLENPFPYSLALHWLVFSASSRSQSVRILCQECERLPINQRRLTFPCLRANPSMADKRGDYCVIPFFRHILRNRLACDRVGEISTDKGQTVRLQISVRSRFSMQKIGISARIAKVPPTCYNTTSWWRRKSTRLAIFAGGHEKPILSRLRTFARLRALESEYLQGGHVACKALTGCSQYDDGHRFLQRSVRVLVQNTSK